LGAITPTDTKPVCSSVVMSALCRIAAISQELVKFDTQQMEDSEISGVGYQQGTLAGYEIREFLLENMT